jgi:hypothetical protein
MPIGPGKYDDLATYVREQTQGRAVVVIVVNGNKGSGFSAQTEVGAVLHLPKLLRVIADEIEGTKQ